MKVVAIVALLLSLALAVHGVAVSDGTGGPPKWPENTNTAHGL